MLTGTPDKNTAYILLIYFELNTTAMVVQYNFICLLPIEMKYSLINKSEILYKMHIKYALKHIVFIM